MIEVIKKHFIYYLIEAIVASVVYYFFGMAALVIWVYIMVLFNNHMNADHLRKVARVFQFGNISYLRAIASKLDLSEDDIDKESAELQEQMTEEQRNTLQKDFKDAGGY